MRDRNFRASAADTVARFILIPLLAYSIWRIYDSGDEIMAGLMAFGLAIYTFGVVSEYGKPLFAIYGDRLRVRDGWGRNYDISFRDVSLIDTSPWIGMKVTTPTGTHRLFVGRLSAEDRADLYSHFKNRTGLDFS